MSTVSDPDLRPKPFVVFSSVEEREKKGEITPDIPERRFVEKHIQTKY